MIYDGKTEVYGVIGNPIAHTFSPQIQNTVAKIQNRNMVYVPFHVESNLESAIRGAYALQIKGLNITVPYKQDVIRYCCEVDSLAAQIGAVNTLVWTDKGYKGYNTDMPGLLRALKEEKIDLSQESVILLGAGGVARAIALLCASQGVQEIYILNRTIENAEVIVREVTAMYPDCCMMPYSLSEYEKIPRKKYLTIQCTSVGLYPDDHKAVLMEDAFYDLVSCGYDLIYRPLETEFMRRVQKSGGKAYNGLHMLYYQAIIAYELWTKKPVSEEEFDKVKELLKTSLK